MDYHVPNLLRLLKFGKNFDSKWSEKSLILFGAGSGLDLFCMNFPFIQAKYAVDNDKNKWGQIKNGLLIKDPLALYEEDKENTVILITSVYYHAIAEQLKKMGFQEKNIFGLYMNLLPTFPVYFQREAFWLPDMEMVAVYIR
jgi:hypothetical protein